METNLIYLRKRTSLDLNSKLATHIHHQQHGYIVVQCAYSLIQYTSRWKRGTSHCTQPGGSSSNYCWIGSTSRAVLVQHLAESVHRRAAAPGMAETRRVQSQSLECWWDSVCASGGGLMGCLACEKSPCSVLTRRTLHWIYIVVFF